MIVVSEKAFWDTVLASLKVQGIADAEAVVGWARLGRKVVEEREALRLMESELDDYGWGGADETLVAMQKFRRILADADRLAGGDREDG